MPDSEQRGPRSTGDGLNLSGPVSEAAAVAAFLSVGPRWYDLQVASPRQAVTSDEPVVWRPVRISPTVCGTTDAE